MVARPRASAVRRLAHPYRAPWIRFPRPSPPPSTGRRPAAPSMRRAFVPHRRSSTNHRGRPGRWWRAPFRGSNPGRSASSSTEGSRCSGSGSGRSRSSRRRSCCRCTRCPRRSWRRWAGSGTSTSSGGRRRSGTSLNWASGWRRCCSVSRSASSCRGGSSAPTPRRRTRSGSSAAGSSSRSAPSSSRCC